MNYLIYGEDSFLVKKEIDQIRSKYDKSFYIDEIKVDAEKTEIVQLLADLNTIPLGTDYRFFIIKNINYFGTDAKISEDDQKLLLEYLTDSNDSTIAIFVVEKPMDQRKRFVKEFIKNCNFINISTVDINQFKAFVRNDIKKKAIKIDDDALEELLLRLPPNYEFYSSEINKLASYPNKITFEVVDALITKPLFGNDDKDGLVFVNDLLSGNMNSVISKWNDMCVTTGDPHSLIGLIASQFRFLYQVKLLVNKGYSNELVSRELNAHVYRVTKSAELLNKYTLEDVLVILNELSRLDLKIKSGAIDAKLGFEVFLFQVTRR